MSFIQNLFTSRDNNAQGNTYVGQQDRIWWDPDTNAFYYSDGNTAGGIPIGTASGSGIPIGPINSVQLNAGSGNFLGTSSLVFSGNVLTVGGNVTADYFIGDGSQLTNLPIQPGTYSNTNVASFLTTYTGNVTAGNISITNTANIGNFTISDQTLAGTITDRDVTIAVVGANANINIDGPLHVHGTSNLQIPPQFEVASDGQAIFRVPTLDANLGAVQIIGTTSGAVVSPGNPGGMLQITGQNNQVSRIYNDAVNNYPVYIGRRYNGTALAPTGVLVNQVISRLGANPYLTDTATFTPLGVAQINFVATENQTSTAQGSRITMNVTPTGSNVQSTVAEFNYGGIILTGNLLPTTDDVYSLGNASLRWVAAHFGNAGIYIQDNTLGDDGQIQLDNGTLNFDNIDSLRVGNLQFTSSGIITTINPALDVLIGNPGDTGNTVIRNAGIKFTDGTIQTTAAIPLTQKGNALGVVPLNASTKIDPVYLPSGAITFKGVWNAANNTPTLADGIGVNGDEYIVGVGGTQNLGSGNITFAVGDFVLYTSANVWVDIPVGTAGVDTFNGRSGIVTLESGDVTNALSAGSIVNSKLQNPNVTVTTGTGISGGQVVPLGGNITLTNTGVVSAVAGTGVAVSAATGNVTFSIGQNVATNATVQFNAITSTTTIQATGNVTGGNLVTGGRVVATGNIVTSGYFFGNGSQLTGLNAFQSINANGTTLTANSAAGLVNVLAGNNIVITSNVANANIVTAVSEAPTFTGNVTGGNISSTGNISDANGLLRSLPINNQVAAYTLTANDNGNLISITTGNVTVPAGVFASPFGQAITVYNNSAVTRFITQGANVTLRLAGTAATGNRTLTQRGLATIVCVSANTFVVSGVGLS
jgi:hypothetical protein